MAKVEFKNNDDKLSLLNLHITHYSYLLHKIVNNYLHYAKSMLYIDADAMRCIHILYLI